MHCSCHYATLAPDMLKEQLSDPISHDLLMSLYTSIAFGHRQGRRDISWDDGMVMMPDLAKAVNLQLPGAETDRDAMIDRLEAAHRDFPNYIHRETSENEVVISIGKWGEEASPYELHFPFGGRWYPSQKFEILSDGEFFHRVKRLDDIPHPVLRSLNAQTASSLGNGTVDLIYGRYIPDAFTAQGGINLIDTWWLWNRAEQMLDLFLYSASHASEKTDSITVPLIEVTSGVSELILPLEKLGSAIHIPAALPEQELIANLFFPFKTPFIPEDTALSTRRSHGYDIFGITATPLR